MYYSFLEAHPLRGTGHAMGSFTYTSLRRGKRLLHEATRTRTRGTGTFKIAIPVNYNASFTSYVTFLRPNFDQPRRGEHLVLEIYRGQKGLSRLTTSIDCSNPLSLRLPRNGLAAVSRRGQRGH